MKKHILSIFSKISLKCRLLITYLLLSSLILLITSVSFYKASRNILIERSTRSSQQQLSLITSNLKEKIDHISDYAITLSISSTIADVLKENPTVPENELYRFLANSDLTNQVQRIIGLHKNICAWDILDTENNWFHSSTTITDELTPYLSEEFLESLRTDLSFHFLGPFIIEEEPVFAALKSITNLDNTKYLGTVVLLIKESNISSAFQELPDSNFRNFYIVDENNIILSSSFSEGIFSSFSDFAGISTDDLKLLEKNDTQTVSINGSQMLLIRKEYSDLNWHIINQIPLEYLTLEHQTILKYIIFISFFLLLLSFILSILCTKTVTAPIQRLASKMEDASQGNLGITAVYSSNDELSVLYNQFNRMMKQIQQLLNNIYEEQNAKQKMEIQLLQSQINPHFLYNTLSTIKSLVELDMNETAVKAISAMSSFYRNSLSKGQFIIPLTQELLLTEQYLYIQNLRYMEFVEYEIFYDPCSIDKQTVIPKLTIQPIVENIFVHALSNRKCHISVSICMEKEDFIISVSDDGTGISRERLTAIQQSIKSCPTSSNSFGLPSINHRIELLYGKEYGISIDSHPGIGTTVKIHFPKGGKQLENPGHY